MKHLASNVDSENCMRSENCRIIIARNDLQSTIYMSCCNYERDSKCTRDFAFQVAFQVNFKVTKTILLKENPRWLSLREKCSNAKFFLVCIFLYSG